MYRSASIASSLLYHDWSVNDVIRASWKDKIESWIRAFLIYGRMRIRYTWKIRDNLLYWHHLCHVRRLKDFNLVIPARRNTYNSRVAEYSLMFFLNFWKHKELSCSIISQQIFFLWHLTRFSYGNIQYSGVVISERCCVTRNIEMKQLLSVIRMKFWCCKEIDNPCHTQLYHRVIASCLYTYQRPFKRFTLLLSIRWVCISEYRDYSRFYANTRRECA